MAFETKYPVDPTPTLYHAQKTISRGEDKYLLNPLFYEQWDDASSDMSCMERKKIKRY